MFDAQPFPETLLKYCHLDPWKQILLKSKSNYGHFLAIKSSWMCHLQMSTLYRSFFERSITQRPSEPVHLMRTCGHSYVLSWRILRFHVPTEAGLSLLGFSHTLIINNMTDLVTQGARASATMVLTQFSWKKQVSALEELSDLRPHLWVNARKT